MRKENFTLKTQKKGGFLLRTLGILVLVLSSIFMEDLRAQCPLACDDNVQVSLDEYCLATITPDMLLEDMGTGCTYTVVVYNTTGLPRTTPTVGVADIGKTLKVAVFLGNNQCWGSISVEDKFPPVITCPTNDTVYCNVTNYTLKSPIVQDNCTASTRQVISDNVIKYACDSVMAGVRIITYYYQDASGNRSDTCEQRVYFRKIDFNAIVWPSDKSYSCEVYDSVPALSVVGFPTLAGFPLYPTFGICKIAVAYEDQLIPVCPHNFKVLRKWTVIDWCKPAGQNIITHFQIIKITDEKGPILSCSPNMTVSTDVWSCSGTAVIPPPTIISECSENLNIKVGYKIVNNGTATYEGTSTSNVTKLANGYYSISGLPYGLSWVIFRVTDECGNYTDCATEVLVTDQVPPVAVCDQKTVVSLTIDGTAKVEAASFDDRSHDNCELDSFQVVRMDGGGACGVPGSNTWQKYVHFCCSDIGKTIMVNFRAIDKAGNSNTCMVEVVVQDKVPPVIVCPPHITVSCEYDYPQLSVFGKVATDVSQRNTINVSDPFVKYSGPAIDGYAYDGCGVTIKVDSFYSLSCGKGTITRRFVATETHAVNPLTATCSQIITVQDRTPNNITVDFPSDFTSNNSCMSKPQLTPDVTGKPTVHGADKCSSIATTYDDLIFTFDSNVCLKVLRTWTVIDWCVYQQNSGKTDGIWTWKQIIKINNVVPPSFVSSCADRTVDVFGPGCQGQVDLVAEAHDDCTDDADLIWSYTVDLYSDNVADPAYSGNSRNASRVYPTGKHKVTFRVKDLCNNEKVCTYFLTVRDGKKPTPFCLGSIHTVIMPSSKNLEIWAKDLILYAEDNCTEKSAIKSYFFINSTFVSSMTLDCSNIGMNKVKVYVVDEAGNFEYCEAVIELQDPNGACDNGFNIAGKIMTNDLRPVNNVNVVWERLSPLSTNSKSTNVAGLYTFNNIVPGSDYIIHAEKSGDYLNGITTHDIVLIQKHILGQVEFDSPYKYIAADANNSETVSAADLSEIRKLILGKTIQYYNQTSWRFVPMSYVFPNPTNPFPYTEKINFNGISSNQVNADFYAVKIGDINGNAEVGNFGNLGSRSNEKLELEYDNVGLKADQENKIQIIAKNDVTINGLQFAININRASILNVNSALVGLNDESIAVLDNEIRVSYAPNQEVNLTAGDVVLEITIKTDKDGLSSSFITTNASEFISEAYDQQLEVMDLTINSRSKEKSNPTSPLNYELAQNNPNPFSAKTQVEFKLPQAQNVEFMIYDMNGKVVFRSEKFYQAGSNSLTINKSDLSHAGIYYLQMNAEGFTDTKKMVLIR